MRCSECNKFPSFETQEPEADLQLEGTTVTGSIRLVLNTECCGVEAKEANFDGELDMEEALIAALIKAGVPPANTAPDNGEVAFNFDADGVELSMDDDPDVEAEDYYQTHTPKGKPISNPRYRKHFYKVVVEAKVHCKYPVGDKFVEVDATGTWTDEIQASAMEELS